MIWPSSWQSHENETCSGASPSVLSATIATFGGFFPPDVTEIATPEGTEAWPQSSTTVSVAL